MYIFYFLVDLFLVIYFRKKFLMCIRIKKIRVKMFINLIFLKREKLEIFYIVIVMNVLIKGILLMW